MAVYTEVTDEALSDFHRALRPRRGRLVQGHRRRRRELATSCCTPTDGQFILTLYEKRVRAEDLPFFIGLMEHLAQRGVTCPQPVRNRVGEALGELAGRPAAIVTFLDGLWIRRPNVGHCGEVGEALGAHAPGGRRFRVSTAPMRSRSRAGRRCFTPPRRAPTRSRRALREEMRRGARLSAGELAERPAKRRDPRRSLQRQRVLPRRKAFRA